MNNGRVPGMALEPNWPALVPVAQELRRWVDRLPVWSDASGEARSTFKRRLGKQELDLAEKLRRIPGCTITRSPNGSTTLTLAGLEATAQGGLAAGYRSWIIQVRRAELGLSGPPT